MSKHFNICLMGIVMGAMLAGCTLHESAKVSATVDRDFSNAHEAFEMSKRPNSSLAVNDTVSMSDGVWLGNKSMVSEHKNKLPSRFETDTGVTILLSEPVTLQALANDINSLTKIPVKIDSQIDPDKLKRTVDIAYTGKLSGLLSQIATDLDLLWYYDKGTIVFYETETRSFALYALGTDVEYNSSLSSDDGSQVMLQSAMKEWEEVELAITSIIGDANNAQFTVSRSLGTITVTASPSVLDRVAEYIARQNKRLSQLITIDVKVLQVSLSNNSAFGLNLAAAVNSVSGLNLVATPSIPEVAGASTMNVAVLSNNAAAVTGVENYYSEDQIRGGSLARLAGSSALVEALAKQGKVSLVTNVGVTTRNNRVAPITNTKTQGYIKRLESRSFVNVDTTSTVDQDELETGFSMQLLPNVLENGKILLLFKMSVRELLKMDTQKVGGDDGITLQLPEVEERSFMQEVIMESGQMLVVSGFEKQSNNDTRYGLGDADFMALSGLRDTKATREVLVVILTPQVLASPMDAERNIQQHWGAPLE